MAKQFDPFSDPNLAFEKTGYTELVKVQSSNILYVGYDESNKVMTIIFHDADNKPTGAYQYKNIPENIYKDIKRGKEAAKGDGHKPSVGGTFCKLVKVKPQQYPYKQVDLTKALRSGGKSLI